MTDENKSGGVTIGNVTGGIHGSIIAGRDVTNATIMLGGQPTPADKEPTVDKLTQLLAEIQQELAEVTAQGDALSEVSSAAPFTAQGVEQSVKDAAGEVAAEMKPEAATAVQGKLTEATTLLSVILNGAKNLAQRADATVSAVQPLVEKLEPLVDKVGVAALWVARLWLSGGAP